MKDPISKLLSPNANAKSDVANKLISMFLHELSKMISKTCSIRVRSKEYARLVRETFNNLCPYCSIELTWENSVVEHLDGMNRLRAGLHVPGNVLVACKECNNRKRLDDSRPAALLLASSGWGSFLSHDGARCKPICSTCEHWKRIWPDDSVRKLELESRLAKIQLFRDQFADISHDLPVLAAVLPSRLVGLYLASQTFAETQIESLLKEVHEETSANPARSKTPQQIDDLPRQ